MQQEETTRMKKVARQVQKDLAEIIRLQGMAQYDGALISVTNVRVSPDLSLAKVWLSIFPSEKTESVMKLIEDNNKLLRGALGHRVGKQFRIVPELAFLVDDSLDYVEHIDELLKK